MPSIGNSIIIICSILLVACSAQDEIATNQLGLDTQPSLFQNLIIEEDPYAFQEWLESFRERTYGISVADQYRVLLGEPIFISLATCDTLHGEIQIDGACKLNCASTLDTSGFFNWRSHLLDLPVSWKGDPSQWPIPMPIEKIGSVDAHPKLGDVILKEYARLGKLEKEVARGFIPERVFEEELALLRRIMPNIQVGRGLIPTSGQTSSPVGVLLDPDILVKALNISRRVVEALQYHFPSDKNQCVINPGNDNQTYFCPNAEINYKTEALTKGGFGIFATVYKLPLLASLIETRYFSSGPNAGKIDEKASQNKKMPLTDLQYFSLQIKQFKDCPRGKESDIPDDHAIFEKNQGVIKETNFLKLENYSPATKSFNAGDSDLHWGYAKCREGCSETEKNNIANRCCEIKILKYGLKFSFLVNAFYKGNLIKIPLNPSCDPCSP